MATDEELMQIALQELEAENETNLQAEDPSMLYGFNANRGSSLQEPAMFASKALSEGTFGLSDQLHAGLTGLVDSITNGDLGNFNQYRSQRLQELKGMQSDLPDTAENIATGLGFIGSIPVGGEILQGASKLGKVGKFLAEAPQFTKGWKGFKDFLRAGVGGGATLGAVQGAGSSDATSLGGLTSDVLEGAGIGGLAGGGLTAVGYPVAKGGIKIVDSLRRSSALKELLQAPETATALGILEREGKLGQQTAQQVIESGAVNDDLINALRDVAQRAQNPEKQIMTQLAAENPTQAGRAMGKEAQMLAPQTGQKRIIKIKEFLEKSKAPTTTALVDEVQTAQKALAEGKQAATKTLRTAFKDLTQKAGPETSSEVLAVTKDDIAPVIGAARAELTRLNKSGFTGEAATKVRDTIQTAINDLLPKTTKSGSTKVVTLDRVLDIIENLNIARKEAGEFAKRQMAAAATGEPGKKIKEFSPKAISSIQKNLYKLIENKLKTPAMSRLVGLKADTFSNIAEEQAALMTLSKILGNFEASMGGKQAALSGAQSAMKAAVKPTADRALARVNFNRGIPSNVSFGEKVGEPGMESIIRESIAANRAPESVMQNIRAFLALNKSGMAEPNIPQALSGDLRKVLPILQVLAAQEAK